MSAVAAPVIGIVTVAGRRRRMRTQVGVRIYDCELVYSFISESSADLRRLDRAELVWRYMADAFAAAPEVESFWVIFLDRKNHAKGRMRITTGTATAALAHPREVLRPAILASACAIICVHNHPSGDPAPSAPDLRVTREINDACRTVQIDLLDHVICGQPGCDPLARGYFSFREAGML